MQVRSRNFISFLSERNREFIDQIFSESAFGLHTSDIFEEEKSQKRRKCILISFDPPLSSPPFIFNWAASEVHYFNAPVLEKEFYEHVDACLEEVEFTNVVFVERKGPPHLRKINRWIRNYLDRNKSRKLRPGFFLAEYRSPLFNVRLTELHGEVADDTLSA